MNYTRTAEIERAKTEVLQTAKQAFASGLMAGTSGNLSIFDPEQRCIVITPSGYPYDRMTEDDLVVIALDGTVLDGFRRPSSEWRMHAELYRALPDRRAIVHTHSPYATAFAALRQTIPCILVEMQLFLGGAIETAPYAEQGSAEVGTNCIPILSRKPVCLLANHGVVVTGETLAQTYTNSLYVEDSARIYHLARTIGTPAEIEEHHHG
ncbi:MAG: class II aldolase/adducin family protein [Butyricicoccus sp.]